LEIAPAGWAGEAIVWLGPIPCTAAGMGVIAWVAVGLVRCRCVDATSSVAQERLVRMGHDVAPSPGPPSVLVGSVDTASTTITAPIAVGDCRGEDVEAIAAWMDDGGSDRAVAVRPASR
jgi:hypothetical protein